MTACRSRLSPSTTWAPGSNPALLVWRKAPLPTEPSHWPPSSCTRGWPPSHYVLKDGSELSILQPLYPKCWDARPALPCLALNGTGINPSSVPGEPSDDQATTPVLCLCLIHPSSAEAVFPHEPSSGVMDPLHSFPARD